MDSIYRKAHWIMPIQLTLASNAHPVGVFLDEFIYRSYNVVKVMKTYKNYEEKMKEPDAKDKKKRDDAAQQFQKACSKAAGIHFIFTVIKVLPSMT